MRLLIERQNRWTFELTSSNNMSNISCHPTYTLPNSFPTGAPFPGAESFQSSTEAFASELATPKPDAGRVTKPSYSRSFKKQFGKLFNIRLRHHAPAPVPQSSRAPQMQDIIPSDFSKHQVDPVELEGAYYDQGVFELEGTYEGGIEFGRSARMDTTQSNMVTDGHLDGSGENSFYPHSQEIPSPMRSPQTDVNMRNSSQSHFEMMHPHRQSFPMRHDVSPVSGQYWTGSFQNASRYSGSQYGGPMDPGVSPFHHTAPSTQSSHESSSWNSAHDSCESSPVTASSRGDMMAESGHRQAFLNQSPGPSLSNPIPFPSYDDTHSPHRSVPINSVSGSEPRNSPIHDLPDSFEGINHASKHRDHLKNPDPARAEYFVGDPPPAWEQTNSGLVHSRLSNDFSAYFASTPVHGNMSSNHSLHDDELLPRYGKWDMVASRIGNTMHLASEHSELKALQDKEVVKPEPQPPNELIRDDLSSHTKQPSLSLLCTVQGCLVKFTGQYCKGNLMRHRRQFHPAFSTSSSELTCNYCSNRYHRGDALKKHLWKEHQVGVKPKKRRIRSKGRAALLG